MNQKIKLIVSDLDGTLFYDGQQNSMELTAENLQAIRRWIATGRHFMLASGRTGVMVDYFYQRYGLKVDMIACNGGKIILDQKTVAAHPIASVTIERMARILEPFGQEIDLCLDMEAPFKVALHPDGLIQRDYNPDALPLISLFAYLQTPAELPCKLFLPLADSSRQSFFYQLLAKEFDQKLALTRSSATTLEACNLGVSKGTALIHAASQLGIKLDEIFVVGDEENDLELFKTAVHRAVMAQARPVIKAYADLEVHSVAELIDHCL